METLYALNNLGSLYRELGILAEARAALARASELAAALGHAHMQAMVLANRGEVDARAGDLAPSRERYERALAEFVRLGARDDAIETRRRLSELDLTVGRVDEALARALEAARDARDGGNKFEEGVLHRVAASALRCQGDFESAAWFVDRARELLSGLGARYELAKVAFESAELAHANRDDARAREHLATADAELVALGARWNISSGCARYSARSAPPRRPRSIPARSRSARATAAGDADAAIEPGTREHPARGALLARLSCYVDIRSGDRGSAPACADWVRAPSPTRATPRCRARLSARSPPRASRSRWPMRCSMPTCASSRASSRSACAGSTPRRCGRAAVLDRHRLRRLAGRRHRRGAAHSAHLDGVAMPLALALDHGRLLDDARRSSELMSILAHEIRNPLAGILGYSEMGSEAAASSDGLARGQRPREPAGDVVDQPTDVDRGHGPVGAGSPR